MRFINGELKYMGMAFLALLILLVFVMIMPHIKASMWVVLFSVWLFLTVLRMRWLVMRIAKDKK